MQISVDSEFVKNIITLHRPSVTYLKDLYLNIHEGHILRFVVLVLQHIRPNDEVVLSLKE